ncbi:MAG: hypothetical protein LBC51_06845 [Treponema sp.]|jgi:hypothetical protein|nr:hypothetical protein [Treponema sp.]
MKNDKHTSAIPEAAITQAYSQIAAVIQLLAPYTIALTPHERQIMLKMGDKSLAFVEKAHDYAHANPTVVPSYLNMTAFDVDFQDAHGLWSLVTLVKQLEEALEDTIMTAGSEAYHAALAFYHNVQAAAKDDVPGAKAIFEDLKTRFPGSKRQSERESTKPQDTGTERAGDVQNLSKDLLKV